MRRNGGPTSAGMLDRLAPEYAGMTVSEAKRLKTLETENARLKKLLAEAMLEQEVTREVLRKKW